MRRPISSKSDTCTESMAVYAAGISVKVGAHYPGRSADLPCATGIVRCRDGSAEVSRGYSRLTRPSRRPEHELQTGALISMTTQALTKSGLRCPMPRRREADGICQWPQEVCQVARQSGSMPV
jgi:hypothetical protein